MDLPLYRRTITGSAVDQSLDYQSHGSHSTDETEDLFQLLSTVLEAQPSVKAVSVGAILSNYQRTRVEHVCVVPCNLQCPNLNTFRKVVDALA
jgi:diphthine-ammonia ligase